MAPATNSEEQAEEAPEQEEDPLPEAPAPEKVLKEKKPLSGTEADREVLS